LEALTSAALQTDLTLDWKEICGPMASAGLPSRPELAAYRARPSVESLDPPDAGGNHHGRSDHERANHNHLGGLRHHPGDYVDDLVQHHTASLPSPGRERRLRAGGTSSDVAVDGRLM
jgi:hypothetical protein